MVNCPKCSTDLDFEEDELDEGDEFTCEECGANLRVTSVDPIELDSAESDEDEDEDEFEDEDDEDEDEEDLEEDEDAEEEDKHWR